jgi:hypothetical protein
MDCGPDLQALDEKDYDDNDDKLGFDCHGLAFSCERSNI